MLPASGVQFGHDDGKVERRERVIGSMAAAAATPIAYLNLVGGQDELIFDGHSAVFSPAGDVVAHNHYACTLTPE